MWDQCWWERGQQGGELYLKSSPQYEKYLRTTGVPDFWRLVKDQPDTGAFTSITANIKAGRKLYFDYEVFFPQIGMSDHYNCEGFMYVFNNLIF